MKAGRRYGEEFPISFVTLMCQLFLAVRLRRLRSALNIFLIEFLFFFLSLLTFSNHDEEA
jgi:hypothetical protein